MQVRQEKTGLGKEAKLTKTIANATTIIIWSILAIMSPSCWLL